MIKQILPVWKKCRGCQLEWGIQSINEYGFCPDCHAIKFNGVLRKSRLWQMTIHDFWDKNPDKMCCYTQDMPKGTVQTLYSLSKFEYVPPPKSKTMRDEINE
jgi:hypothetical protein